MPLSFLLHPRSKFEYKWRAYGILLQLYYNRFQRFDLPMKPFRWVKNTKFTTRESRLSNSFVTRFFPRMKTKHAIPWLNQLWASSAVFEFDPTQQKQNSQIKKWSICLYHQGLSRSSAANVHASQDVTLKATAPTLLLKYVYVPFIPIAVDLPDINF